MRDLVDVLLTVLLVGANAFFVGAEFSLISVRRDRLEALAEQGRASAATVIRAGERLPLMFAGAQFGITVSSILLGRIGEPAVADLLHTPLALLHVSGALLHTVSFVVALAVVVTLHVLLGEMVPKNIAIAGPEKAAMLLVPPYLAYVRAVRPLIGFYNWSATAILRLLRVPPKDELDVTVSTVELSEMIAESVSEGCWIATNTPGSPGRCKSATALSPTSPSRSVMFARCGWPGRARADGGRGRRGGGRHRLLPVPRGGSWRQVHRVSAHQGRVVAGPAGTARPTGADRSFRGAPTAADSGVTAAAGSAVTLAAQQKPSGAGNLRRSESRRDGCAGGLGGRPGRHGSGRNAPCLSLASPPRHLPRGSGPRGPTTTAAGSTNSWPHTTSAVAPASRIRCGIFCSATTPCGPAACGAGIPASAWCSPARRRFAATGAAVATPWSATASPSVTPICAAGSMLCGSSPSCWLRRHSGQLS
ncbi:hypothetical protein I553_6457 [Mycobacterium xenopi 4042]|uniref:CNNM transmembrane domain-containing protein n=1 Tax=Mycobacterium xenopi 4042 TaxID=1299334 RepID=X8BEN1_MYCXE|nr:hypothetical protein I553_6457 [Mycobacterium xenopi 4042]